MTARPNQPPHSRGLLGPIVVLAVLGICSGSLAVYLTLRVPKTPVPNEVQTQVDAIQQAIGPTQAPPEAAPVPGEPVRPGHPRQIEPPTRPASP